ncbi:MAG: cysteine desulfurase family protein [Candidatus Nanopelagicales bacterium]
MRQASPKKSADPPRGYLDAASAQPIRASAREALAAALDQGWADPARRYRDARRARLLLDAARESVAARLGARPDEVSFTASGTQAAHLAVAGLARGRARAGDRVVASAVEHSAVLHAARAAGSLETVPVDRLGRLDLEAFAAAVGSPGAALAAVQSANHEVGTRQPVAAAAALAEEHGVPLLVDAAQSVGREAPPAAWSVLTAHAPAWGGPAGVGVLAVRTGVRWRSPSPDDPAEGGRVPGPVAVPLVVAAAAALEEAEAEREAEGARIAALVDRLRARVPELVPDAVVLGDADDRLPHIVTFSFLYVDGESLLDGLDREGFAASSGSSCVADALEPSHVLAAMGALTQGNLRLSLPAGVREDDVDRLLHVLPRVVADVRAHLGAQDL